MKNHLKLLPVIAALWLPVAASAQSYSINWYKISGGGGMNTTGGVYSVSGTIGQHDAGGPMTGGGFQLTGVLAKLGRDIREAESPEQLGLGPAGNG